MTEIEDAQGQGPPRHADGDHVGESAGGMMLQVPSWTDGVVLILAAWLMTMPLALDYAQPLLAWSDVVSGGVVMLATLLAFVLRSAWPRWIVTAVGLWLLLAPLIFAPPSAAVYTIDTLIGTLLIAFAILVPGMPGMRMTSGATTPPGWSYNPSTWVQRTPMIALALFGFFLSRHLAAYQLGHVHSPFDPIFDTRAVLDSDVSRMFPISDAGLGAAAYIIEALSGFMGGSDRWRTMPWMVLMFAILVVPLGVVSIVLIILQPVAVGAWCLLCLVTALLMLIMIPVAVDEVVAMAQFLKDVRRRGDSVWKAFWLGGSMAAGPSDEPSPPEFQQPWRRSLREMFRGVTLPLTLAGAMLIGGWLMLSPVVLSSNDSVVTQVLGALVIVISVTATAEPVRAARYLNLALAALLLATPLLAELPPLLIGSNVTSGIAIAALSFSRGKVAQRYAGWDRAIV